MGTFSKIKQNSRSRAPLSRRFVTFPFGIFAKQNDRRSWIKTATEYSWNRQVNLSETKSKLVFFYLHANCMNHINKTIQSRLKWCLFHVQCMHFISNKSKHTLYFTFKNFSKNIKSRITPLCLEFSADKIHFIYYSTMTSNAK